MVLIELPGFDRLVSQIALGTADMGTRKPTCESLAILDAYVSKGGNLLDTAHCYASWLEDGHGASEQVVGEFLRSGADVMVATKGGHPAFGFYSRPEEFMSPEVIRQDFEESTERLGRTPDIWYYHRDDPRIPVDELVDAAQAINSHYLGVSNWRSDRLQAANDYARRTGKRPFVAWQNQWSLADPGWSDDSPGAVRTHPDLSYAKTKQVSLMPYTSSANGFFSGRNPDQFRSENNLKRRQRVSLMALERGVTGTQIALAWLMNQPFTVIPIVGTLDSVHLEEAISATKIRLSADDLAQLAA